MINYSEITFVITTFKSEKIIFKCLSELPEISPKIILENSGNFNLKNELKKNFQNLECFVMEENIGYGRANNIGISKSKTKYIFIINPDTFLSKKNLDLFLSKIKKENFSIASVLENHDQKGNRFILLASSGKSNVNNSDILDLINVRGKITSDTRDTIYIVSDFAQYNSINLNSKFYENVIINYQDKEITCKNFDINMNTNKAIAYNNVLIVDPKSEMKAGIVEFDLKTKNIEIKPESALEEIEIISD